MVREEDSICVVEQKRRHITEICYRVRLRDPAGDRFIIQIITADEVLIQQTVISNIKCLNLDTGCKESLPVQPKAGQWTVTAG